LAPNRRSNTTTSTMMCHGLAPLNMTSPPEKLFLVSSYGLRHPAEEARGPPGYALR
jgi:hypothetical protein